MLNEHTRTQARLLIDKLLSLKDESSPLNLIFDSAEQSARPMISEYIRRAYINGMSIIFVSYDTLVPPVHVGHFIEAQRQGIRALWNTVKTLAQASKNCIIIFDSVSQLLANIAYLPEILFDVGDAHARLVLTCHASDNDGTAQAYYGPKPVETLEHMATTVIKVLSLPQVIACKIANDHSKAEPSFGIDAETEGVIVGVGANPREGLVAYVEYRRRSGRVVGVAFVLSPQSGLSKPPSIVLIQEHPGLTTVSGDLASENKILHENTFVLSLTKEQKIARDGVMLPYFDAQTGSGEGGRILYDMDREDDFDEEEDEA